MAATDNFRKQHVEIIDLVHKIEAALFPERLGPESGSIRSLLNALLGKLSIHLAMEDKSLYPRLSGNPAPEIRDTAKRFASEMSGMQAAVDAYGSKWTAAAIAGDPHNFCAESGKLFAALGDRIKRENAELYPLADRI